MELTFVKISLMYTGADLVINSTQILNQDLIPSVKIFKSVFSGDESHGVSPLLTRTVSLPQLITGFCCESFICQAFYLDKVIEDQDR